VYNEVMVKKMKKFNKKYIIIFVLLVLVGLLSQVGSFTDETSVEYDKYSLEMNTVSEMVKNQTNAPYNTIKRCVDANQSKSNYELRCYILNTNTLANQSRNQANTLAEKYSSLITKYSSDYFKDRVKNIGSNIACNTYVVINENRAGWSIKDSDNTVEYVINCTGKPTSAVF
jgi:hypothetical protein